MAPTVEIAKSLLVQHGQSHVLQFWDQLDSAQRDALLGQIAGLDFERIAFMRKLLQTKSETAPLGDIEPAPVEQLAGAARRNVVKMGEQALRSGQVGVILVAGGQGSRLGFAGPKGAYPLGPIRQTTLFAVHARKVLALERKYATEVPFYIMTSDTNDADTRAFFESNRYFGLTPSRVHFFVQGMWPALTEAGRIILDRPDHIFMSPDGHGGTVSALRASGHLDNMEARGLRHLFYFQVDNPLVDVADPAFLGFHAARRAAVSLKLCAKRDPEEKLGVMVLRDGRQAMVEYTELTHAQNHARLPDGHLKFRFGSVAIHIFDFAFLKAQAQVHLPLHVAHKKVAYCDDQGRTVTPPQPNAYKFETFIFDVIPNSERVFNLEFAREEEFSPVKNGAGDDSPATAVRDLMAKHVRWLEAAGVCVPRNPDGTFPFRLEVDPVFAMTAEDLVGKLAPTLRLAGDLVLE